MRKDSGALKRGQLILACVLSPLLLLGRRRDRGMKRFHRWSVPRQVTGCVASRSKSGRTPATLCRSVNTVRVLGQPCEAKSRPLWPRATNESGSVADEPFATSRTSRRGGGFHLHVPRASWQPCAPVGRANWGPDCKKVSPQPKGQHGQDPSQHGRNRQDPSGLVPLGEPGSKARINVAKPRQTPVALCHR